ncbi:MAG: hypothetical protein J6T02_05265 [Bacteroidales bacterium]|nr:hypothetical protein [Bacteroidales bacterium]
MKKLFYIAAVALSAFCLISCKKDNISSSGAGYGIDGRTPMPKAVDIGTVDKDGNPVLWASFNLGASKEYEYGNYYAWGEKEQKTFYSWGTYIFANGSYNSLVKYCTTSQIGRGFWDTVALPSGPDGLVTLEAVDDVASDRLGGKWRTPLKDDWTALLALKGNEDYEWEELVSVPDGNGNDILGVRITRKSTGATLFFPAAGYCYDARIGEGAGNDGNYWSSSIQTGVNEQPQAAIYAYFTNSSDLRTSIAARCNGMSVRPVMTK